MTIRVKRSTARVTTSLDPQVELTNTKGDKYLARSLVSDLIRQPDGGWKIERIGVSAAKQFSKSEGFRAAYYLVWDVELTDALRALASQQVEAVSKDCEQSGL